MEIEVSALMEAHPNQKVLLFLAMDDAFTEEEDHAHRDLRGGLRHVAPPGARRGTSLAVPHARERSRPERHASQGATQVEGNIASPPSQHVGSATASEMARSPA